MRRGLCLLIQYHSLNLFIVLSPDRILQNIMLPFCLSTRLLNSLNLFKVGRERDDFFIPIICYGLVIRQLELRPAGNCPLCQAVNHHHSSPNITFSTLHCPFCRELNSSLNTLTPRKRSNLAV